MAEAKGGLSFGVENVYNQDSRRYFMAGGKEMMIKGSGQL
jgi:hypothetical protein